MVCVAAVLWSGGGVAVCVVASFVSRFFIITTTTCVDIRTPVEILLETRNFTMQYFFRFEGHDSTNCCEGILVKRTKHEVLEPFL